MPRRKSMNNNTQPGAAPTTTSIAGTPDATTTTTAPDTSISTSFSSAPRKLAPPNSNCITCKVKHRKCDREKPVCKRCQHFNVPCEWPPAQHVGHYVTRYPQSAVQAASPGQLQTYYSSQIVAQPYPTVPPQGQTQPLTAASPYAPVPATAPATAPLSGAAPAPTAAPAPVPAPAPATATNPPAPSLPSTSHLEHLLARKELERARSTAPGTPTPSVDARQHLAQDTTDANVNANVNVNVNAKLNEGVVGLPSDTNPLPTEALFKRHGSASAKRKRAEEGGVDVDIGIGIGGETTAGDSTAPQPQSQSGRQQSLFQLEPRIPAPLQAQGQGQARLSSQAPASQQAQLGTAESPLKKSRIERVDQRPISTSSEDESEDGRRGRDSFLDDVHAAAGKEDQRGQAEAAETGAAAQQKEGQEDEDEESDFMSRPPHVPRGRSSFSRSTSRAPTAGAGDKRSLSRPSNTQRAVYSSFAKRQIREHRRSRMRLNRGYDTDSEEEDVEEEREEEQRGRSREDIAKPEPAEQAIVKEEHTHAPPLSAHRGHEEQRESGSSDTSSSSSPSSNSNASPSSNTHSGSELGDSERKGQSGRQSESGSESRDHDHSGGFGGSTPLVPSTPIKRESTSARAFEIRVPSARRYAARGGEGEDRHEPEYGHGHGHEQQSSQELGDEGEAQANQEVPTQKKGQGIFLSDSESRSEESQYEGGRNDEGEEHHEQDQTHEGTPPAEQTQPTSGPRRPGDSDVDMPDISKEESHNPLQRVLDGIAAVGLSSFESTQDNQVARVSTQSRELQTQDREDSVDDDYDADYISVYGDSDDDNDSDSDALQVLGGGNIALRHKLDAMRAAQPGSNDRKAELYKQYLTHFHCVLPIYDNKQCGAHEHYGIKNAATDPHADGIALLVREYLAAALGALALSPFDAEASAWFNAANAAFVPDASDAAGETFASHCHPVHEVQILLLKTQYYLALMQSHKGWEAVATAIRVCQSEKWDVEGTTVGCATEREEEEIHRAWWACVVLERRVSSLATQRPTELGSMGTPRPKVLGLEERNRDGDNGEETEEDEWKDFFTYLKARKTDVFYFRELIELASQNERILMVQILLRFDGTLKDGIAKFKKFDIKRALDIHQFLEMRYELMPNHCKVSRGPQHEPINEDGLPEADDDPATAPPHTMRASLELMLTYSYLQLNLCRPFHALKAARDIYPIDPAGDRDNAKNQWRRIGTIGQNMVEHFVRTGGAEAHKVCDMVKTYWAPDAQGHLPDPAKHAMLPPRHVIIPVAYEAAKILMLEYVCACGEGDDGEREEEALRADVEVLVQFLTELYAPPPLGQKCGTAALALWRSAEVPSFLSRAKQDPENDVSGPRWPRWPTPQFLQLKPADFERWVVAAGLEG